MEHLRDDGQGRVEPLSRHSSCGQGAVPAVRALRGPMSTSAPEYRPRGAYRTPCPLDESSHSTGEGRDMDCICGPDGPRFTRAEKAVADSTGMDLLYIHIFMDTWESHADRLITEGSSGRYHEESE